MFVRFVVGTSAENPAWLTGVITEARILRDQGELHNYEESLLEEVFEWFNSNLPCPPFKEKLQRGEWTPDAVSWFRSEAKESIGRIWDIIALLKEHGVPVRLVSTAKPGEIVYADDFQVVAETPKWA